MVLFIHGQSGKSKQTGNPYHRYSFLEVREDEKNEGKLFGYVHDFFAESEIDVSKLECGDVVKVGFENVGELSDRKKLISIDKVENSLFRAVM